MKDKILEILEGGIELEPEENYHTFNDNRVASEIADMNKKFVEWCMKGTFIPDPDDDSKYWDFLPKLGEVSWTFDELFTYWFDNIKDK